MTRATSRGSSLILAALLAAFALTGVFGRSLWGPNDAREGGMIWDMYRHDVLVAPLRNGVPYLEKPPLMFWAGLIFCRLAGRVTEGLLRLPSALAGLGTLIVIFRLVRSRDPGTGVSVDSRAAWASAFLCATTLLFMEYSRVVLTDMTLTFAVTTGIAIFWQTWNRPRSGARAWIPFVLAGAASFFAKGLVGPAMIAVAVGPFLAWRRRFRLIAGLAAGGALALALLAGSWAWALAASLGPGAVRSAFWDNQIGRFFSFSADPAAALPFDPYFVHKEPWYFYAREMPPALLPWTPLILAALLAWWRPSTRYRDDRALLFRCATLGPLVLLHLSSSKVGVYALPVFPFLAAMAGTWLADVARNGTAERLGRALAWSSFGLAGLAAVAVPAAVVWAWFVRPDLVRVPGSGAWTPWLAAFTAALALAAAAAFVRGSRGPDRPWIWPLGPAAFALLLMPGYASVAAALEYHRTVRPVAALASAELAGGGEAVLASDASDDPGAFNVYLDRRLKVFVEPTGLRGYLERHPRAVIVARRRWLAAVEHALEGLPSRRLEPQAVGRRAASYVVLVREPS